MIFHACRIFLIVAVVVGAARAADPPPFASLDKNGDGKLSYEEALGESKGEGRSTLHWQFFESDADDDASLNSDEYAKGPNKTCTATQEFRRRDEDRNQELSLPEFLKNHGKEYHKQLARDFLVADLDGNSQLSSTEHRILPGRTLAERGPVPDPINDEVDGKLAVWRQIFPKLDSNGDGRIEPGEFVAERFKELEALRTIPFDQWDRDKSDSVEEAEGDHLIRIAYGAVRPDGEPLRHPSGRVINWVSFRRYDKSLDGKLTREEFVATYWDKAKSAEVFAGIDRNSDGVAQTEELLEGPLQLDTVERFLWLDTSLDGSLDQSELDARCAEWEKGAAKRVIPCYDENTDGRLSLQEYRLTPLANPSSDWFAGRTDKDHDGVLSFEEFYFETSPILLAQSLEVFRRFDRDRSGNLSLVEWDFAIDPTRVPAETAFGSHDRDRNGRLTAEELVGNIQFTNDDGKSEARGEAYRRFTAEMLTALDSDKSGDLELKEFQQASPEPQLALYRDFLRRDLDLDGRLSRDEYVKPNLGSKWEPIAREEAVRYDINDDGFLSWEEFEISPPANPLPERRFAGWDRDRNGTLDESEFLRSIPEAERVRHRWPFLQRDLNADGRLDFEEWQAKTLSGRIPWQRAFTAHDIDGDGRIGRKEYLSLYPSGNREAARQFLAIDFDSDGFLTSQEFTHRQDLDVPAGERGAVPDAISQLCNARIDEWKAAMAKADSDQSGSLSAPEWAKLEWGALAPSLGATPHGDWDQNGDRAIDESEGKQALRVAFGVENSRGEPCRFADGGMVNANHVQRLDKDSDGKLTSDEFATGFSRTAEENRKRFDAADGNHDGFLDHAEYSIAPDFRYDRVSSFLWWDANQSGLIEQDDLQARAAPWQLGMLRTLIAAFDVDGDQALSFREFDGVPFANLSGDWYAARDQNGDGRLAWEEFRPSPKTALAGIARHYFDGFDRDGDGFLSLSEVEFPFDPANVSADVLLGLRDRNRDGRVDLAEILASDTRVKVPKGDTRSQRMREYYEGWFAAADGDRDGSLSSAEFQDATPLLQPNAYEIFASRDVDQNKRLSREEYFGPNLGTKWETAARSESEQFDVDKDGFLDWREFRLTPPALPTRLHFFTGLDADNDGRLSLSEILGMYPPEKHAGQRIVFRRLDRDGDGLLARPEWLEETPGKRNAGWEFRVRDDDGNGELTYQEFSSVIGEEWRKLEARNFRVVDWNQDGRLSLDEFRCLPGQVPVGERGPIPDPLRDEMELVLKEVLVLFGERQNLSRRDWERTSLRGVPSAIASLARRAWDRDGDGQISQDDCRKLLEVAYGIRDEADRQIRLENGRIVNLHAVKKWDRDLGGTLSRSEFVGNHWKKVESEPIFEQGDLNHNGEWDWNEIIQSSETTHDILGQFLWMDIDGDGAINQAELDERSQVWQKSLAKRLIAAFDADGNRRLSFVEFRRTPFANPLADWYVPKKDADNDSQLSWDEFFGSEDLPLVGVWSRYFDAFDQNRDDRLTFDEFEFVVDFSKIAPEVAFRIQDKNSDGKLVLQEIFEEPTPAPKDREALERYEMRLAAAETRFLADDKDHDSGLSLAEFQQSRDSALAAAERKTKALTRHRRTSGGDWFYPVILVVNAVVLLGGGWYLLRRSA